MTVFLSAAVGLILTAFVLLQQIALWQRKEYRLDRLRAEFQMSGRSPKVWGAAAALIALLTAGVIAAVRGNGVLASQIGWLGLLLIAVGYVLQTARRGLFKPRPTVKAGVILALALALAGILIFLGRRLPLSPAFGWLLLIVMMPGIAAAAVAAGNVLGRLQKERIITRARGYRAGLAKLTVIGITGSYGKTSTKYFLHHLLSADQPDVIMSAQHRNEAFAVAQDLLARVTASTNIYIAEMGAYRRGEIQRVAAITQPIIGVLTAIGNQHVALFGSPEALAAAKWELIDSLPKDGIAVLNADDSVIVKKATGYSGRIVWYSLARPADVWADDIVYEATTSRFRLHLAKATHTVSIPLPGAGYVSAAVAAAAAAHAADVPADTIAQRLATLPPVPQTMAISTNSQGSTIIDDSYSANEAGVVMALRQLARFPQPKKIVVLRPLIELGNEASRVHATIGQELARVNATVYLYDAAGAADIEEAAKQAGLAGAIRRIAVPKELAQALTEALDGETVCLLENRLPDIVRRAALA